MKTKSHPQRGYSLVRGNGWKAVNPYISARDATVEIVPGGVGAYGAPNSGR